MKGPSSAVFLGTEVSIVLTVLGEESGLELQPITLTGPLELVRVFDDLTETPEGTAHTITWTYRVSGAGQVQLGPIQVRSGRWESETSVVQFPTTAPPDHLSFDTKPEIPIPSDYSWIPLPGVERSDGLLLVRSEPRDVVTLTPPLNGVELEHRERGQPIWKISRFPTPPASSKVTIYRGKKVVFETL